MTTQHTPGPWVIAKNADYPTLHSIWHFNAGIGIPTLIAKTCYAIRSQANANLIASSPELLEALELALGWIDAVPKDTVLPAMPGFDRDWVNGIVEKARGGCL